MLHAVYTTLGFYLPTAGFQDDGNILLFHYALSIYSKSHEALDVLKANASGREISDGYPKYAYVYTPFLGNQGIKTLVLRLYSGNSGCFSIFFSNIGIPDTFKIKKVMMSGPIIPTM
jgi:hypothetical protein